MGEKGTAVFWVCWNLERWDRGVCEGEKGVAIVYAGGDVDLHEDSCREAMLLLVKVAEAAKGRSQTSKGKENPVSRMA